MLTDEARKMLLLADWFDKHDKVECAMHNSGAGGPRKETSTHVQDSLRMWALESTNKEAPSVTQPMPLTSVVATLRALQKLRDEHSTASTDDDADAFQTAIWDLANREGIGHACNGTHDGEGNWSHKDTCPVHDDAGLLISLGISRIGPVEGAL